MSEVNSPGPAPNVEAGGGGSTGAAHGPLAYINWRAQLNSRPSAATYEYPLFTDAYITGAVDEGLGPYQLLNPIASRPDNSLRPAIVLRSDEVDFSLLRQEADAGNEATAGAATYHGGGLADEIAALVSLCLGIRVKAGAATREFRPGGDPKGYPNYSLADDPALAPLRFPWSRLIPAAFGDHDLCGIDHLQTLVHLSPGDAGALVVSARSYQNALWLAEAEPELAWLLFVTALETAAVHSSPAEQPPAERLRAWNAVLHDLLHAQGGDPHVEQVAEQIVPVLGATSKFVRFVLEYLPEPPAARPPEAGQLRWSKRPMREALSKVYGHRSLALHTGRPFPLPMCDPPALLPDGAAPCEVPLGATRTLSAAWAREDTPMLLHTFEYIVRHTLLNWWSAMVGDGAADVK
jgi:hypothetical protein